MEANWKQRLETMEKKYRRLQWYLSLGAVIFVLGLAGLGFTRNSPADIIRTRGIIVEDEQGRDRILIGAPIPASRNRVRTDTALVRKHWAGNFGKNADQYMKWYRDYYHGAEGIVIMNEEGFDRVLVGDKLADPNTGKRMFTPSGMLWNDARGWERGGAGVNTTEDGQSRSVVGVDDSNGEAVHMVALEDGTRGLMIGGPNGHLLIGMSGKNGEWFKNKEAFTGLRFFDLEGKLVWEQRMPKPKP